MTSVQSDNATTAADRTRWRGGVGDTGERVLAVEMPVAIVVNGSTYAVMLATPADLEDFARGFVLTEGIVGSAAEIDAVEIVGQPQGIEARLWIAPVRAAAVAERRRHIAGPTGCGLCGVESLAEAARPPRVVTAQGPRPTPDEIVAAMAGLDAAQPIGAATRAVHAAALWRRDAPLTLREDVGRHNALDKLVGAVAGQDAGAAMLLLTSRVSVEMVQKASVLGAGIVVAVSAPTSLAVEAARAAGITLIAVARADGFELFSGEGRVLFPDRHPG